VKSLRKTRRIQVIAVAAVALVAATGLVGYALRDGINLFRSPTQVLAAPPSPDEVFRIGGLVEAGSLVEGEGTAISFRVTDGAATVPVVYSGIRPDLFGEGQGVVALGRFSGGTFEASEILAKHDESYMPREVIDALKEQGVYVKPGS
jgi:cytochrome c-type biogenesis protein CcmE